MKKINILLVFANRSVREQKAYPEELRALLQEASDGRPDIDAKVHVTYARSLSYLITNERVKIRDHRNHRNLNEYDLVYFRKAGSSMQQMQTCARYLRECGIPFYDTELLRSNSRNKLSQMLMLQQNSVPVPKTLFCRNNRRLLRLVTKKYRDEFAFPVIVKATGGTRGDANYLVQSAEELKSLVQSERRHFLVQEYIPNDGDYRFFVVDGSVKGVIKRSSVEGSHLSNTSKGAQATLVSTDEFSSELRSMVVRAAVVFGRDCAGVDVMFDSGTGRPYVLEVNRAPQIEGASFEGEKAEWLLSGMIGSIAHHQPTVIDTAQPDLGDFVGRFERVKIFGEDNSHLSFIAKVDTGADSCTIHFEKLEEDNGLLRVWFSEKHAMTFDDYFERDVRSSSGTLQKRYYVKLNTRIGSQEFVMNVTLSNRSDMRYPMLIGRRFLRANNLLVNVGRRFILSSRKEQP